MSEIVFVPFGEFAPDLRYLGNDSDPGGGMLMAREVVPVYGSYIAAPDSPLVATVTGAGSNTERGLHVHFQTGDGYAAVDLAGVGHLYQMTEAGVVTDRSRAAFYTGGNEWHGCSFGPYVIMANGVNEVQFRDGGGGAAFANMITSTFAPIGKFPFAFKTNLFLANLTLPSAYDTLPIGANPTVVAWSRNEDIRQFGSFNVDPQIIGAGFQPLNFDIGDITGAIGGTDYALIACSNGFVRIEGPPYTFSVVADSCGCLHPYSLCRVNDDVYFWGPSGLMRLRGGFGPAESVGLGKFTRSLIDNATGFSSIAWQAGSQIISGAYDFINGLMLMAYRSMLVTTTGAVDPHTQTIIWHNTVENRSSVSTMPRYNLDDLVAPIHYLRTARQGSIGSTWSPARDVRFLSNGANVSAGVVSYRKFDMGLGLSIVQPLVLHRGYRRFKANRTTRIKRIRPVYGLSIPAASANYWIVRIESTNQTAITPTVHGPFSFQDEQGWTVTPTTSFTDWHSVKLTSSVGALTIHDVCEFRGFEVEIEEGPVYSA